MSRIIPQPPDLVAKVRELFRRVRRLEGAAGGGAPVVMAVMDTAAGQLCAGAEFAVTHARPVMRAPASALWVDALVQAGAGSEVAVRLTCPDLGLVGEQVVTGTGGAHWVRAALVLPEEWPVGAVHLVCVEAYRVSGADTTRIQVVEGRQR